jgi:hypothetical protein
MYSKLNEELHKLSADLLRTTQEKEEALCLREMAERNAAKQQSLSENVRSFQSANVTHVAFARHVCCRMRMYVTLLSKSAGRLRPNSKPNANRVSAWKSRCSSASSLIVQRVLCTSDSERVCFCRVW